MPISQCFVCNSHCLFSLLTPHRDHNFFSSRSHVTLTRAATHSSLFLAEQIMTSMWARNNVQGRRIKVSCICEMFIRRLWGQTFAIDGNSMKTFKRLGDFDGNSLSAFQHDEFIFSSSLSQQISSTLQKLIN